MEPEAYSRHETIKETRDFSQAREWLETKVIPEWPLELNPDWDQLEADFDPYAMSSRQNTDILKAIGIRHIEIGRMFRDLDQVGSARSHRLGIWMYLWLVAGRSPMEFWEQIERVRSDADKTTRQVNDFHKQLGGSQTPVLPTKTWIQARTWWIEQLEAQGKL